MSKDWFIRATTKTGVTFVKDYWQTEAILIFKIFHEAAEKGVYPESKRIPETWRTEIFESFMLPDGDIVLFELCEGLAAPDNPMIIYNFMWIEKETEGRFKIKTHVPVALQYTFTGLKPGNKPREWLAVPVKVIDGNFGHYQPQADEEMSADWHMRFFESGAIASHEELHAEILKAPKVGQVDLHEMSMTDFMADYEEHEREQDNLAMGINDLAPKAIHDPGPQEGISMTFEETLEKAYFFHDDLKPEKKPIHDQWGDTPMEKDVVVFHEAARVVHNFNKFIEAPSPIPEKQESWEDFTLTGEARSHTITGPSECRAPKAAVDLAPKPMVKGTVHDVDWYSAPSIEPNYRIYLNNQRLSTDLIVDDISFMKQIDGMTTHNYHTGGLSNLLGMPQALFELIAHFFRHRDFKIGAHPIDEELEDDNGTAHSIFWNDSRTQVVYVSPMADTVEFKFDDIDLSNL